MVARVFAVLSALFLVVAVSIAALTPLGQTLAQGLQRFDPDALRWINQNSSQWMLTWVEIPILMRPLWLLPASAGVVCAGLAASFNLGKASPSRRRRS